MRAFARPLAAFAACVILATCSDATGPGERANGSISLGGPITAALTKAQAMLAGSTLTIGKAHVIVTRPPSEIVLDTVIVIPAASAAGLAAATAPLTLDVDVNGTAGDQFNVTVDFQSPLGTTLFSTAFFSAFRPEGGGTLPGDPEPSVIYVGPGSTVQRIRIAPRDAIIPANAPRTFTIEAFDQNNAIVANAPVGWSTTDPGIASISAAGVLQPTGQRGGVTVLATTPSGISDQLFIQLVPPVGSITLVSGGGQTGGVGDPLPQPVVVQVRTTDGQPAAGENVTFTAPAGGSVSPVSAITDANGRASTTVTLGSALGAHTAIATVKTFSVNVPATAVASGAATVAIVSGNNQQGAVNTALSPLSVRVTDRFGFVVQGAVVTWTRTSGGGVPSSAQTTTGADGVASVGFTFQFTPGPATVTAAASGAAAPATFTLLAIGPPGSLIAVSGDGQTAALGAALAAPLVVQVNDGAGTPLAGVTVSWTATNGVVGATSGVTGANGRTSTTFTTGTQAGAASARASVGPFSATFTATTTAAAAAGIVASGASFVATDAAASTTPFGTLPAVIVRDAFSNPVSGAAVSWTTSSCAAGWSLAGATSMSNASGIATSPAINVPSNGTGSCRVSATLGGGGPLTFLAIAKPAGFVAWLGTTTAFASTANWSSGAAPTAATDVYFPLAAPSTATLGAAASVHALTMEDGVAINLGTNTLTVTGDLAASATSITNGTVKVHATAATTIRGSFPTLEVGNPAGCIGASYSLSAATTTTGNLTINCGLTVGAQTLTVGGAMTVSTSNGKLRMSNAAGVVDVTGLATFQGNTQAGAMTDGTLRLRNGLTALRLLSDPDVFETSGNHITQFVGAAAQTVDICASCLGSEFGNTEFVASSSVTFASAVVLRGTTTVRNGATVATTGGTAVVTVGGNVTAEAGSSLSGVSEMIVTTGPTRFPIFLGTSSPALVTLGTDLPMTGAANLTGSLVLNRTLTVGAQALTVAGNLSTATATGKLNMTTAGGSVVVMGNATFAGGSTDALITNGTTEFRGDVSQGNAFSANAFKATGSHLTKLNGTGAQTINFVSSAGSSQFNDLSVENTSGSGVTATSIINVARDFTVGVGGGATAKLNLNGGNLNVGGNLSALSGAQLTQSGVGKRIIVTGALIGGSTADLGGVDSVKIVGTTFPVYNNTTAGKAPRVTHITNDGGGTMNVAANGTIAGGLIIQRAIVLNGKALVVKDSFHISPSGSFDMSNTAGTLTVGGHFKENGGDFNPGSGSLVTLNGTSTQLVSFNNASNNFFGSLDITNTSSGGVELSSNAATNGNLRVRASANLKVPAARTLTVGPAFTLFLHNNSTVDVAGTVNFSTCEKGTGVTITGAGSSGLATGCTSSGSLP